MKKATAIGLFVAMSFGVGNVAYAQKPHGDGLPPGLQKKAARGQNLPPGWQKKLAVGQVMQKDIYDQGTVVNANDNGLVTIRIDGRLVRLIKDTREIVQILNGD